MQTPSYVTFIGDLITKADLVAIDFIKTGFANLSDYMAAPVATACVLLIVLLGYGMLQGLIDMSVKTLNKTALTIGAVYVLCFSYSHFSSTFVSLFLDVANDISGVVIQGKLYSFSYILPGTGVGLSGALQTILIESVKVGGLVMAKGGFTDWMPYVIGLDFMLIGTIVVGLAVIELVIAKLFVAMLLAVAPFFIACLLFPQTKGLFDGWLNQLKGFSIVLLLVGACVGLCMNFMHWAVGGYYLERVANISLYSTIPLIIVGLLCVFLLLGLIPIAKQIGGSHGGSGFSSIGGAVGGFMGAGMKAASGSMGAAKSGGRALGAMSPNGKLGQMAGQAGTSAISQSKQLYSNIRNYAQKGNL